MKAKINYFCLGGIVLSLVQIAHASSVEEYFFEPDATYPVHTALGIVTQIELSPREVVKDFGSGLSGGWDLVRRENVFYLKPKDSAVDTNLIVRTQAHQYIFELKVVSSNWKTLSDVKSKGVNYKIKFRYPSYTDFNLPTSSLSGYSLRYDPSKIYHTNYDVAIGKGAEWLVPLKIYDDEKFTYIYLNKGKFSGDFPTVYGRKSEHGEEFVLNSNVEDNTIIVHGTYPVLVLRHGKDVVGLRRN
ncbi:MAG: TrbG/VirB9 family P-type conjugative transfer protein [Neisseria sp.]|uniref:TrbG/VirB9 family P-type conjugative transfer protein n=1 Tax=Neisseria sp. TaxID=192066 RepID=UPI0026DDC332|nr:TrbG/VirB9 family P-type conjugative transfer protein [Neisseria sp.]MDO4640701.1 TrbG/VirB9 family P-type conjugative transfer protein [Neisseria sp.]